MFNSRKRIGFTQKLEVQYISKIETDTDLKVEGRETFNENNNSEIEVAI